MTRTAIENRLGELLNELADHARTETQPIRPDHHPVPGRQYRRLVAAAVVVVVALAGTAVVWTAAHDSRPQVPVASSTATTLARYTLSPAWRNHGPEIRADKATRAVQGGYDPLNKGDFAYLSDPADVTGPGTHDLTFSIDDQFDYPNNPQGFVLLPPPDISFQYTFDNPHIEVLNGVRTFHLDLIVNDFNFRPYPQVSFWLA